MVDVVRLKNGVDVQKALVAVVMMAIESMFYKGQGLAVFDLYRLCKDPDYPLFRVHAKALKDVCLIERVSDSQWGVVSGIKDIMLSAIVETGDDMNLTNPVQAQPVPDPRPAS